MRGRVSSPCGSGPQEPSATDRLSSGRHLVEESRRTRLSAKGSVTHPLRQQLGQLFVKGHGQCDLLAFAMANGRNDRHDPGHAIYNLHHWRAGASGHDEAIKRAHRSRVLQHMASLFDGRVGFPVLSVGHDRHEVVPPKPVSDGHRRDTGHADRVLQFHKRKVAADHLKRVGGGLETAVNNYNKFVGSFERNVLSSGKRLAEKGIEIGKREIEEVPLVESAPRYNAEDAAEADKLADGRAAAE